MHVGRFPPRDLAGIVVMLRFGATLRDEDLPGTIEYASSKEGLTLAFPLQTLLVLRGRMDGAARLTTAALVEVPRDRLAYSTWKRWEYFFGQRADIPKLIHDFCHQGPRLLREPACSSLRGSPRPCGRTLRCPPP